MIPLVLRSKLLLTLVFVVTLPTILQGYLLVVNENTEPGTTIFNASVYKLGSDRHYKINVHRSANFVHHLLKVDHKEGTIVLKKRIYCDGIFYPNLFTFYVDSTSNRLRTIGYYSLPLRIFVSGTNCNDEQRQEMIDRHFDEEDVIVGRHRRKAHVDEDELDEERLYGEYHGSSLEHYIPEFPWLVHQQNLTRTDVSNFVEGDVLFDTTESNTERHKILNRKRRALVESFDQRMHRKIVDAKQWISETYASYAIHTTGKWNKICLKQSQFINNLNSFMPKSIIQHCRVNYLDLSDERFDIERKSGDMVASKDICILEQMWKITVTFNVKCDNRIDVIDADHRLKIVYHHEGLNDTDIAKRVKRELRNQSPYFEKALYVASVLEEQPPGASVTKVKARDPEDSPVVYSMVSLLDSRSQSMFKVDSRSGLVTTSLGLDRELMDVHYFRVVATDDSFPPRSGTTTLQINVLDCNDHSPVFEAEQFETSVRETATISTPVITLRASDQDMGKNAEIEYSIDKIEAGHTEEGDLDVSQLFRIDSKSGVITTRGLLDREVSDSYVIYVKATDLASPQTERKSSKTTVLVKILDDNDNYPQFSERTYTVQVSEDQWGDNNIIAHIQAKDADLGNNGAIRYAIIGGNTLSQFTIDSMSGDVTLVKPLDYENVRSYRLVIRAQDGGSPSRSNTTQLLVNVIDANDNAPRFYTTQFQEAVLESVPVGYNIVRVQAYDSDEGQNSEITYSIPDRKDNFPLSVDPRTGWIHTTRPLDREEQSRFSFQVTATDGGIPPKSSSTSVVVTVQDVNDNDPIFSPKYYEAILAEDQAPGTPVTSVTATDLDEDVRLHYEITSGNTRGRFAITSQNGRGLVTIAQPLDFKQEKRFLLSITATDSGGRSDTATLNINITDANNFAPTFENAPYTASVNEDAPLDTTILVVSATDADVGINAQITYYLNDESANGLGSSDPFTINPQTGAITTNAPLDRETTSAYLLTVTAKDGGNPSLSDTTEIEIFVADVNDSPPTFKVPLYQASILEDALIGTSVVQLTASDADQGLNGRIRYALSQKDMEDGSFVVDPASGVVRTNKALDRESIAVYHLQALAIDKGTPPLTGTIEVQVRLEDINDSPPSFESEKITLYVAENSPVGSVVGEVYAHDPDEGVNALVQYSILESDDSNLFSLVTKPGSDRAQLLTMTELDYESPRKRFELHVRASSPPLRSDVIVEVLVTDVNDNAPILRDFQVIFNNYKDRFPSGIVGRVPAFDADVTDKLFYKILSGNNANLIKLNASTGGISLSPQLNTNVPKHAAMEISVTDGINEVKAIMQLSVRLVNEDMLFNSVTVRLDEMTEEAFLSPLLNYFLDGLAAIIPCPKENIFIFSIQDDADITSRILNVSFSARRADVSHEEYYSSNFLQERVYLNRAILARLATVTVLPFDDNICLLEPCLNFEKCSSVLKFGNASGFIHSDTVLFRPIYPVNSFVCSCPEGFTGSKEHYLCDTEVNLCYSNPCQNGGSCVRREGGYTCLCDDNRSGENCELPAHDTANCHADICDTGYSCVSGMQYTSFGSSCQLKSRSFTKNSFLTFESLKQRHRLNIRLKFATIQDNGLLLYNGRFNDKHDFIALELINGHLTFSFSLGDKIQSVSVTQKKQISDGHWHSVQVDYFNRTATVIVDNCDIALALPGYLQCANHTRLTLDRKCASLTETCHRFLDLTGPLQIGGLPRIPVHFQIQSKDYVGCISDLHIDQKLIDLNTFVADNGTIAGCPQKHAVCESDPCYNGGTCHEGFGVYRCECPEGFSGNSCQEAVPSPWRFNGDGIISFNPLLRPIQIPWYNSLSVRTIQRDAFLMQVQIGQNNSATLSVKSGMLCYTYNNEQMCLAGSHLSDGEWHRIEIKWLGNEIQLSTDYGERQTFVYAPDKIQGVYVGKIVIGGIDGTIGNLDQYGYFEGCIQDVRVGGQQSILQKPTIRENVLDGCISQAECPDECPLNSQCVTSWDQATCECIHGYVGPKCVPVCTVKPCTDAGQCRADTSNVKGFRCDCTSDYHSGEYCEISVERPCPTGWWGERECGPCKCNLKQGYHPDCDKESGECRCRDNHYQPVNETACLPCDCYIIGSLTGQCDKLTGQCDCRDGVIGRRCDSCSNPYAEVTLTGCEVVYDACPKSFAAGLWWPRTNFGQSAIESCPGPAKGKAIRVCETTAGGWNNPDLYNCTSQPFLELRKQLSAIEKLELEINSFVSVKIASDLQYATQEVGNSKIEETSKTKDIYSFESSHLTRNSMWNEDFDINYLSDEVKVPQSRLYGADILITEGLLQEILNYEIMQSGLNLSHSQDKYFIQNIVASASIILDKKYLPEWRRLHDLIQRGSDDLIDAFSKYLTVLASYQHDTYTDPFEIVHDNMAFGLDVVTSESLFGYEPHQLNEYHRHSKGNQYTTESVILPDTSAFLTHSSKQRIPTIAFPKYNNYIMDKRKFDKHTKVQIPLDMLGITPPETNEVSHGTRSKDHRAIVGYAQYKDAGVLFPQAFDETITRRYGVDIEVATPVLSLAILVPTDAFKEPNNKKLERIKVIKEEVPSTTTTTATTKHQYPQGIQISAQDHDQFGSGEDTIGTFAHLGDTYDFPPGDHTTDLMDSTRKLVKKRDISNDVEQAVIDTQPVVYRSLGAPYLSQPIKLQMWLNIDKNLFSSRSNPQCVRWNTFMNMWTRIGCQTQTPDFENMSYEKDDPILINCTCTHISSYAVIVDVIDPEDIPEPSLFVQLTSYSAFLMSLPILFGVIIALALLRGMQTNSNTIHQNLVFCLFIAELLFFVGMQARRELIDNEFSCKLVAIGLHYAWLAAFAWMTVDCIHLYRMLTEMRDINHGPMGFYFAMGYGAPALICGLSVGVRVHEYGNNLFCWLSVYENVVWWLVGPVAVMSIFNLLILFVSVKAAFTLKEHVLGFGNLRTLLWLSVVSLPLIGLIWVLQVLSASESSQLLSVLLSIVVAIHAIFCLIGYCVINKRVRENLRHTVLKCMGRKVPLLESSVAISNSSQNIASNPRTPGFSGYETNRRNMGISASSTTSRSTAKTSSSPYSDGQLRHTSTSTSNYNSDTYVRGYQAATGSSSRKREGERKKHKGKESDSDSEHDNRSLELASSHSSDDEESKVGRSSIGTAAGSYLPNIAEHGATTPPELNVVQSPQLFPNIRPTFGSRWSSQAPESFLPGPNPGRWSQETASDAEMQSQKTSSPNPLPNPDLTDTAYLQNRLHMPPSLLENIQENYNTTAVVPPPLHSQPQQYDNDRYDALYGRKKDYQDNYREYEVSYHPTQVATERAYMSGSERDYGNTQVINHMQQQQQQQHQQQQHPRYQSQTIYDKQHIYLGGSKISSPYMSKEHLITETYSPRTMRNEMAAVYNENGPHHSVSSLLKNDYHTRHVDYHSDRMSEGSDKNGYNFPYTAEEDHLSHPHTMPRALPHHLTTDLNNPVMGSRNGSRTSTPPNVGPVPSMQALTSITDTSEKDIDVDAETTV